MLVRELLRRKATTVTTVPADSDLGTAVRLIMKHLVGGLPVVAEDGAVTGFIAERDIVVALGGTAGWVRDLRVDDVMRRPAPTCSADDTLHEVMARMTRERLSHIPVLDGGRLAGVVSVGDMVKHCPEDLQTDTGVLRDYVAAQRAAR